MDFDMAPPHKRRKLSDSRPPHSTQSAEDIAQAAPTPSFSHGIEHLPHAHTSSRTRKVPQRIEEVHLQIHQQAVSALDSHAIVQRRQGTGSASEATLSVTIVASVAGDGSTTGLSTATDSAAASGISSFAATTTITSLASPIPSISSSIADSASSGSSATELASSSSGEDAGTSESSADSSSATTASTIMSNTASGFIGASPTGASSTSGTTSARGNDTSASLTGTVVSLSAASGSASSNLTTSAVILISNGSTVTSRTTIDLDSATGSSSRTTTSSSDTASLGAAFYRTTVNGRVETISRSSRDYTTTFPDGVVVTVPATSGSYLTTTGSDGVTSTLFETTSPTASSADQSTITSATNIVGGGPAGTPTSSASSSTSSAVGGSGNGSSTTAPAGTIAGGVVGGAAGLAVILLIAMLFLRWYRRKTQLGHQALPPNAGVSPDPDPGQDVSRSGPGMAERAGLMPVFGAVPALFRHQNRSREETPSEPSERGFTRVSGRKLPSSFSPGMSSTPPPTMPLTGGERNLSSTSFYRDSAGFYGGEGPEPTSPSTPAHPPPGDREELTLSPGPQRRPTVHTGGPYTMSPTASTPASPRGPFSDPPISPPGTAATAATFDRSDTPSSLDPNRSSRFTEEV